MGDSTAYSTGWSVVRSNVDGLIAPEVLQKTSSGVVRPDFFDWPAYLRFVVSDNLPDAIFLSLGANDGQLMTLPDGRQVWPGDPAFTAEYQARVDEITEIVTGAGVRLYWIGQPMARDAGYSADMDRFNAAFAQAAETHDNTVFIDIRPWVAGPDGGYTDTVDGPDGPIQIRQTDGIHLTDAGGDLIAPHLWDQLRSDWGG